MRNLIGSVVLVLALSIGACSSTSEGADTDFWGAMSLDALEANQPQSLEELVSRSEVAVQGSIVNVEDGPVDDPRYKGQNLPIAALVIKVDRVLAGEWQDKTIKVIVPRQPLVSVADMRAAIPPEQVVVFATDSGIDGYAATFSDLSIVATVNGAIQTPLDPAASSIVVGSSKDLVSVADSIAVAAENKSR